MKEWDPKSKIKQDSEKSIQGSCNKHNHDNAEQVGCLETTENIAINRSDTAKTKTPEKDHKCNFQFFTSFQAPNHLQAEPGYDHGSNSVAEPESEPSTKGEPEVKT